MKFSVIVPVYKVEKYIVECVNSVLVQTFADFELILVDDGSPDRSPEICDSFAQKDYRIHVIHKENGGLSDARNTGIKAAAGEYILFLDSDDFWHDVQTLEKIASALDRTNASIVQFGHELYLHADRRLVKGPDRHFTDQTGKQFDDILCSLVADGKLAISAWSMAISRQFILDNELFFKKGIKTEDLEWAMRVFMCDPVWYSMENYFYAYRTQHGGSISASVDYQHLCDYCWIIESSVERVSQCNGVKKEALMSYLMYHVLIASALCHRVKLDAGQRKEILSRLKLVCKDKMMKYTLDKKVKLASAVYRIFGFTAMSGILGFYLNHRGR